MPRHPRVYGTALSVSYSTLIHAWRFGSLIWQVPFAFDPSANGGNKSYHIEANSAAEITSAFQRVASLMSVQANEVL